MRFGPFRVRTERMRIEAYRRSTGARGEDVPAAFPICWLAEPEIRTAIEQACGNRLPLHEGQSFEYKRPLRLAGEYSLAVSLNEQADPARLVLTCDVTSLAGEAHLKMQTLLRLLAPTMELSA